MKKLLTKISAIIGMILTCICIFCLLKACVYSYFSGLFDDGTDFYDPESIASSAGLFSLMVSVFSLIFYGIDAVVIKKEHTTLNTIIVVLFVVCLILGIWVISSNLRNYKTIIWFISYFVLFIFEIISTIKYLTNKKEKTETADTL